MATVILGRWNRDFFALPAVVTSRSGQASLSGRILTTRASYSTGVPPSGSPMRASGDAPRDTPNLLRFGRMDRADVPQGWQALQNPAELEELMSLFGDFHDACVREIHAVTGHYVHESLSMTADWKTTVHMLIQRQYRPLSAIELRFEEVVGLRLSAPPPDHVNIIINAAFFIRDSIFYWADNSSWTPESSGEDTWVAARKVYWRDVSEWLGARLRYRTNAG
jgi:hypothetical protein